MRRSVPSQSGGVGFIATIALDIDGHGRQAIAVDQVLEYPGILFLIIPDTN